MPGDKKEIGIMRDDAADIFQLRPMDVVDLSYLRKIDPYKRSHIFEDSTSLDIDTTVAAITKEIEGISIATLPWDVGDFITVFLAGLLGGMIDIFWGKPASGYKEDAPDGSLFGKPIEPKIKSDAFFGLGKSLKKYDLTNNPIDAQIPGARLGDHRLYSYGHDLFRFFKGVNLILTGKGPVGFHGSGGELSLASSAWETPDTFAEAALILALHLYKDFWSARSLPIPGCTIIAKLNNDKMPEIIHDLVNNREVNLRVLSGQTLAMSIIEITVRIWLGVKYHKSDCAKEDIAVKRGKMLLLGQSIGLAFNIGKIVVTKNPFFLNVPQILRILALSIVVAKDGANLRNRAMTKAELAVLRTKYETLKTLVLLDEAIYYTNQIDRFIVEKCDEYAALERRIDQMESTGFVELGNSMAQFRSIGRKGAKR